MRKARQLSTVIAAWLLFVSFANAASGELKTAVVQSGGAAGTTGFDGVVEAVRQTVMAAQVPGAVIALGVKAGDQVREGQMLARIDARAATQNTMASQAQVQAARSALDVATKEYERQKQLYQKQYISQAALERAEAQYNATSAQLKAQLAQAGAAHVQSDFYTVKAPYAGVVADVPVALGDMAMPGKPLVTMYDPAALRVTASVPQTVLAHMAANKPVKIELLGLPADSQWLTRPGLQILPTIDAATHSAEVRVDLPAGLKGVSPGMFARVWLQTEEAGGARLYVPASAIVKRAEMTGLYVIDANGRPVLRQVRLGRTQDDTVEVLSGVAAGEHVAVDPQAAARIAR
jgi:RND family efflux transporter MFP subunit